MKGIVWGLKLQTAIKKLEQIEYDYNYYSKIKTKIKRKTKWSYEIIFDNGDCWIALKAQESSRGKRCNISYIDTAIKDDIISNIIKPVTTASPYHAIQYYN